MSDPAKDAERLTVKIGGTQLCQHRVMAAICGLCERDATIARLTQERDEARRSAEANVQRLANVIGECPVCSGDCRCPISNQQIAQPTPDDVPANPAETVGAVSANAGGHSDQKTNASATSANDMERALALALEALEEPFYPDERRNPEVNKGRIDRVAALFFTTLTAARRESAELRVLDEAVIRSGPQIQT